MELENKKQNEEFHNKVLFIYTEAHAYKTLLVLQDNQ